MKLQEYLNKILYLSKQNKYNIIVSIIVSILLCVYFIFVTIPYGDLRDFSSAEYNPAIKEQIIYFILIIPFIIWYVIVIMDTIKNLKIFRVIIYPIILFSLFLCIFMITSVFGYVYSMLCLYVSCYLFPICFVITEIYAIIQDIKTFKNTTLPDDYNKD